MQIFRYKDREYRVDGRGFLVDHMEWDLDFAKGMAWHSSIADLSEDHWKVIRYIRDTFESTWNCPTVFDVCKANSLSVEDLKDLFPTGYLRGACKLAGVTYRDGQFAFRRADSFRDQDGPEQQTDQAEKTYRIDLRGFLVDPAEWDEKFASFRAFELKIPGGLTDEHWRVLFFLREWFAEHGDVPTIYQTCEGVSMDIERLGELFPDGYHRGAVKLAGLRVH